MKAYGRTRGGAPRPAHVVLTASAQCGRNNTRERPLLRSYRMNFGVTYKSARHFIAPRGGGWLVAVLCVLVRGAEGGGPRCVLPALCAPVGPVVKLPDTDRATFSVSGKYPCRAGPTDTCGRALSSWTTAPFLSINSCRWFCLLLLLLVGSSTTGRLLQISLQMFNLFF